MPSPLAHTLCGLGVYVGVCCKNLKYWINDWRIILWIFVCACLPDTDFIPGLLIGYISRYHQMYSHTIGFSVIVTFLVFIVLKLRKAENTGFVVLITFIALSSHLFLDLLNCDTRDPVGIMALWPFTSRHFAVYQVFYAVPHSTFEDVHSAVLLNAALREVLVVGIPLMVLVLLKYLQTNREK